MLFIACAASIGAQPESEEDQEPAITLGDLLAEMIDLRKLAEFPDPPYETIQFSSYDRRSTAPGAAGWFANNDGFGDAPIPGFEQVLVEPVDFGAGRYLMLDVQGPGALVRTWSAQHHATPEVLEVYLDDHKTPLFKGEMWRFFYHRSLPRGAMNEELAEGFTQRDANYFPIPFNKRLRITWTGPLDQSHFHHVNVRKYQAGARVKTFSAEDLKTYRKQIEEVRTILLGEDDFHEPGEAARNEIEWDVALEAGESADLFDTDQTGAIDQITLKIDAEDTWRALRQVILRGFFDDADRSQIESPAGDFFGSGPGIAPFATLPMTVTPDGEMTCRFVMPFEHHAVFRIENWSEQTVRCTGRVSFGPPVSDQDEPMHFHAKWRVNHQLAAGNGADTQDIPFLSTGGRGVYVGTAIMLHNATDVVSGLGSWWGEGDEKIWVDGADFPTWFGTGSEDYFNYSWSANRLFDQAYCAQPLSTGPASRGFIANNRFHVIDAIPFRSRLAFCMELLHHSRATDFSYARIAYYYATPQTVDDHIRITAADVRQGVDHPMGWEPTALGRDENTIFMQAEDLIAPGQEGLEIVSDPMWSGGELVRFVPESEGDAALFRFKVDEAGHYQISGTFAVTPRSGLVSLVVDDQERGGPVDLYTPHLTMLRNMSFPGRYLEPGSHTIKLVCHGKNENSGGMEIGVDFFWVSLRSSQAPLGGDP